MATAALALAGATATARADDDLDAVLAQSVVTTASQSAETTATAPATSSVITAEEIQEHGIRTVAEALDYLSLGFFGTNPAHGVEVGARGVLLTTDYGNHILLLVDGHVVNEAYGGAASFDRGLGVPIELVDHIEAILGPGAVLYGSNAMLGVVNVITKRAKDYRGLHVVVDSDLAVWGKVGTGVGGTVMFMGRPVELTAAIELQHQDGPTLSIAPQPYGSDAVTGLPKRFSSDPVGTGVYGGAAHHAFTSTAPSLYARAVSGDLEISLRASSFQRAAPFIDNLVNLNGDFDARGMYELERWFFADAKYRIPVSTIFDLRVRGYADSYDYDWYNKSSAAEDCRDGQSDGCNRNLRARARWAGGEVRGTFDWLRTNQLVTMAGVDLRKEHVSAALTTDPRGAGTSDIAGRIDEGNIRLGVYAQQTAQPTRWLFLNGGARLDVAEGYPGALSPRAVVGVVPWRGGTLKAIYSRAFRAPSAYERAWEDTNFLRADHLLPEHEDSVEGSFEQQLGAHRLLFGAFTTRWKDLIGLEQLTAQQAADARAAGAPIGAATVYQIQNRDRVENTGFNGALNGALLARRLRYGVSVVGVVSRRIDEVGDAPLTLSPTLYGNGRLSYDLGGDLPTLAVATQFESRRPTDGGFTPTPYAPPLLEVRVALSGPIPMLRGLSYRLVANYAFESTGPYVVGPIQSNGYGVGPQLNPIDRFRVGVGLQYAWAP